jgi:hypothetical protein
MMGDPRRKVRDRALHHLTELAKEFFDLDDSVLRFWKSFFIRIVMKLVEVLRDESQIVVTSLLNSVEWIAPLLPMNSHQLFFLIELTLRDAAVRQAALHFCQLVVTRVDRGVIEMIHGQIIEVVLPYFFELPVDVVAVLNSLLTSLPPETASIPFLAAPPEFERMLRTFPAISKSMNKFQRVEQMCPGLLSTNPAFGKLLLEQILIMLKCERDQFDADIISVIIAGFARARRYEDDPDNIGLIWRCLWLVSGIRRSYRPNTEVIDPTNYGALVDELVRLFLRVLHRPTSIDQYYRAVTTLGDLSVLNIIVAGVGEVEAPSVSSRPVQLEDDFPGWIAAVTLRIMGLDPDDPLLPVHKLFRCYCHIVGDSVELCKFMLPYLCLFRKGNSQVRTILRGEWEQLNLMPDNIGRQIRKAFFDLFGVLQCWLVTPSIVVPAPSWTSLEIMSPEELCERACELKLFRYAFFICDSCTANDNPDLLNALRRHMGDPDAAELHNDQEVIRIPGWDDWTKEGDVEDQLVRPRTELHESCLHAVRSQLDEIRFEEAIAERNKLPVMVRWEGDSELTFPQR